GAREIPVLNTLLSRFLSRSLSFTTSHYPLCQAHTHTHTHTDTHTHARTHTESCMQMKNANVYLLVKKFPSIFLDVSLVEVGSEAHQADLRQSKVSEFDMPQGGDQQTLKHRDRTQIGHDTYIPKW